MTPVKSSNIHAIGYDEGARRLSVQFKRGAEGGDTYHYHDVPPDAHAALMAAQPPTDSHGKHFAANIKGKFKHTKAEG
jgi:KTSC domain